MAPEDSKSLSNLSVEQTVNKFNSNKSPPFILDSEGNLLDLNLISSISIAGDKNVKVVDNKNEGVAWIKTNSYKEAILIRDELIKVRIFHFNGEYYQPDWK